MNEKNLTIKRMTKKKESYDYIRKDGQKYKIIKRDENYW